MFGGITDALNGLFGRHNVLATAVIGAEPDQPLGDAGLTGSKSVRRRPRACDRPRLQHRSTREHANALLEWIQINVDVESFGLILHENIMEFYVEMLAERGWWERSWNPVAHEFDLLTTGGCKPYEWIVTKSGRKARRRAYPIPRLGHVAPRLGRVAA